MIVGYWELKNERCLSATFVNLVWEMNVISNAVWFG